MALKRGHFKPPVFYYECPYCAGWHITMNPTPWKRKKEFYSRTLAKLGILPPRPAESSDQIDTSPGPVEI